LASQILNIKISVPPINPNTLFRPFLLETLKDNLVIPAGFSRPLTLISAPAGFGKTTLARTLILEEKTDSSWYSLDQRDNERNRFWVYFISSIQFIQENIGKGTLEMLRSDSLNSDTKTESEALLAPLLNDLFNLDKPLFLVLDDYHAINNPEIHQDMVFFLENLPPTLHVVVTTRSEPPWPLARWRAKGGMGEIRQKDLRFSRGEVERFFSRIRGLELEKSQLKTLYQKTEGWVTGLQLAAISLENNPDPDGLINNFAGSHRHVFHFLSEEVFQQQPEEIQEFLLQSSVLSRFSVPLCKAVTGRDDSSEIIHVLEKGNIFINPLDEKGEWFRFHPLFADLLLHRIKKQNPETIPTLNERAADWFLEKGEPGEAIRYALEGKNLVKGAEILNRFLEKIIEKEGPGLVIKSLDSFPQEVLEKFPQLIVQKGWFHLVHKGKDDSQVFLEMAGELAKKNPQIEKEIGGMLAVVKAYYYIYSHEFPLALENAEKALKQLPANSTYWRSKVGIISGDARLFSGNPKDALKFYNEAHRENQKSGNFYLIISSGFKVATTLYFLGRFKEAEDLTRDFLDKAEKEGFSLIPRTGLHWTLWGEIEREKGNLEKAGEKVNKGLQISQSEKPSLAWNLLFKIALCFSSGEIEKGLETAEEIEKLHQEVELPNFILQPAQAWKARLFSAIGREKEGLKILSEVGITPCTKPRGGQEQGYVALADILQKDPGNYSSSTKILEDIETHSRQGKNFRFFLESLILQSNLEETKGNRDHAEDLLLKALETGNDLGFFQIFLDRGGENIPVIQRILEKKKKDLRSSPENSFLDYIEGIISSLSQKKVARDTTPAEGSSAEKTDQETVEKLSERELEILRLLEKGNSNKGVAEILFLSPGTVKWHTSNIYGKLGVNGRTHAIARARELGLIP